MKYKNKHSLNRLLEPRSVALVGASATPGKVGNMIAANLLGHGYSGGVYFVNPKHDVLLGRPCYPSLEELPEKVDCVIIAVPAAAVLDVIQSGVALCKNYVIISAGFGETGAKGHNLEAKIAQYAQEHRLTILGPNCLGFIAPELKLNASFAGGMPEKGGTVLISQSGAIAVATMDRAALGCTGFYSVISIGNKMQVNAAELIGYFAYEPQVTVIAVYLEGVQDGEEFLAACAEARQQGKVVIVLKGGRTEEGQKAIALHTGSLAGSDDVMSAAFEKVGIVRAQTLEEFLALIEMTDRYGRVLATKKTLRIGVVTNAGGPGVLVTDSMADVAHIARAEFSQKTTRLLKKELPHASSVYNPVDLLGDADLARYKTAVEALCADTQTDVVVVLLTPQDQTPVDAVADYVIATAAKENKPIIASFIGGLRVDRAIVRLQGAGVVHFAAPTDLFVTLGRLGALSRVEKITAPRIDRERQARAQLVLHRAQTAMQPGLYFHEAKKLAALYNIQTIQSWDVTEGAVHKKVQYPCVVKVDDPAVLHKSDGGGVAVGVKNAAGVRSTVERFKKAWPQETARVIAQPLCDIRMEMIIGMVRDPIFGPVVVVGAGGIYTEILKVRQIFLAPLRVTDVERALKKGPLGFLFHKTRGQAPYDVDIVRDTIINVMQIAHEQSAVQAIDINPLLIYNDGSRAQAVDVKMIF